MSQKQKILLLEDVDNLGKSGDVVVAKAGFVRNFLVPQKVAVRADKHTIKFQEKLKEARAKRAIVDKKDADELAARLEGMMLIIQVKVDPEGRLYGSVSTPDILKLFANEGFTLEKKNIDLKHHIKDLGIHDLTLKLKEGVTASFQLKVVAEGYVAPAAVVEKSAQENLSAEMPAPQEPQE